MAKDESGNGGAPRLLEGYRALDLTDRKGQICGRFLADLGVDVLKIEPPGGDPVRRTPPFVGKTSLAFAHLNANKRTLELDLQTPGGATGCGGWRPRPTSSSKAAPPARWPGSSSTTTGSGRSIPR